MKKVVLITGATGGLGRAFALVYLKRGWHVILQGRQKERLTQTQNWLRKQEKNGQIYGFCVDFCEKDAEQKLYQYVREQFKRIDVLVNNAGFGYVGEFVRCNPAQMDQMIRVNITAVSRLTWSFANWMKEQKCGAIVNIASTGAYHPGPYTAVYYATKAYVASLSEALYYELKPYQIHVVSVCPGALDTPFSQKAGRRKNAFAMSPYKVAETVVRRVEQKKRVIIPGLFYRFLIRMPRSLAAPLIKRQQKNMGFNIDN